MRAFLHRPQTVPLRRTIFQVHLWLGVATGVYLLVVCVTGAALMFRIDMQRAIFPHLLQSRTEGAPADLGTLIQSVQDAYPDHRVSGVDTPTTARPTVLAYVSRGREFRTVLLDPVDTRVLGELPDESFVRTLQDLHFDLLAGRTGRIVNGVGAFCLLAMCLTGFVIWWPGLASWRRALTVDVRRGWTRVNVDLHSAVGFWTLAFVAMWAVTGINFAFGPQVRSVVNAISPLTRVRAPSSDVSMQGRQPSPGWAALIDEARRHMPDQFAARVVLPSNDTAAFQVLFAKTRPTPLGPNALEPVYLDQHTGRVLQAPPSQPTAGDTVMAWMSPLHVGSFGGLPVKVAWFVMGLAPPLLFVTGFIMWWNRVLRGRWIQAASRAGASRDAMES